MSKWHVTELRCKEVINEVNGERLGPVSDVLIDTKTGQVVKLVIYGCSRFFGIMGREEDIHIPWEDVRVIGEETILVCLKDHHRKHEEGRGHEHYHHSKDGFWRSFFR